MLKKFFTTLQRKSHPESLLLESRMSFNNSFWVSSATILTYIAYVLEDLALDRKKEGGIEEKLRVMNRSTIQVVADVKKEETESLLLQDFDVVVGKSWNISLFEYM